MALDKGAFCPRCSSLSPLTTSCDKLEGVLGSASSGPEQDCLGYLDLTDGIALLEKDNVKLQNATPNLNTEAGKVGLRISAEKSNIMEVNAMAQTRGTTIVTQWLEEEDKFTWAVLSPKTLHNIVARRRLKLAGWKTIGFQRLQRDGHL